MSEPTLSDISLRDLTVRHVQAGYPSVYHYVIALEAKLSKMEEALITGNGLLAELVAAISDPTESDQALIRRVLRFANKQEALAIEADEH